MPTLTPSAADAAVSATAGRYLMFRLGSGAYGIAVASVREIVRLLPLSPVPQMPPGVRGVVNLRDRVIPVVDLGPRFGHGAVVAGNRTCIVIVETAGADGRARQTGLLVDGVEDVVDVPAGCVVEPATLGERVDTRHLLGLARVRDEVKSLLDIGQVLAEEWRQPAAA